MNTDPIEQDTLDLFTGRQKELVFLEESLAANNIVIVEGNYGVGKTSLGNYYRLSNDYITPNSELSTDPSWDSKSFLNEVLKYLINGLEKDNQLIKLEEIQPILKKYKYFLSHTVKMSLFGNSLDVEKKDSNPSVETSIGLLGDLVKLAKTVKQYDKTILIQLNNLDLGVSFTQEEMKKFLSLNRNAFQIANINWILTGSLGLGNFLKIELQKFGTLFMEPLALEPLDSDSIMETLKKRHLDSFDKEHLDFFSKTPDLRYLFNKLTFFQGRKPISILDFSSLSEKEKIMIKVFKNKELSQKDIMTELGLAQSTTSTRIKDLKFKRFIVENNNLYRLSLEAYYVMYILKQVTL